MKRLFPWILLALAIGALMYLADDATDAKAELRAVRDSVALVVAQEQRIQRVLEAEVARAAQAAAVAKGRQEDAQRRARVSEQALRGHLAGDTVGLAKLDSLEADHARERSAWEQLLAARDSQLAATAGLLMSTRRELGAVRIENAALVKRVKELEREQGPALACTAGAGATLGGNGVGAVCGIELVRVPLRKVLSVLTPW